MPRLSSSPQRPQLPCLPHLPGADQGAGSPANLSSSGYFGACWAMVAVIDRSHAVAATKAMLRVDVRFIFLPSQCAAAWLWTRAEVRPDCDSTLRLDRSCSGRGDMVKEALHEPGTGGALTLRSPVTPIGAVSGVSASGGNDRF